MRDHRFAPPGAPSVRVRLGGEGPGVLLLHGFASGLDGWPAEELERLASHARVVAVDLPGHGRSDPVPPGGARPGPMVELLAAVCEEFLGEAPAAWLGYSMGARLALTALSRGVGMRALLLESPNPGIEDSAARDERVRRDEAWASRFEADATSEVLDDWLAQPIFASRDDLTPSEAAHQRRVRESADGASLARWLREFGTGGMPSTWDALRGTRVPVHVLVGGRDGKYVGLARRIEAEVSGAAVRMVPDVGHAPHIEAPTIWGGWIRGALGDECRTVDGRVPDDGGLVAGDPRRHLGSEPHRES